MRFKLLFQWKVYHAAGSRYGTEERADGSLSAWLADYAKDTDSAGFAGYFSLKRAGERRLIPE
jgi:hypothetical protein